MNQSPAQSTKNLGLSPMESVFFAIGAAFVGFGFLLFLAGELSGILFNFDRPGARVVNIPSIAAGVFTNPANPAEAWPDDIQSAVPSAIPYYFTFLLLLLGAVVGVKYGREFWNGNFKKNDLNNAQWARVKDIKPLIVQQAGIRGRLVLGRSSGKLIATEPRQSVIVMGPTQTGKTTGFAVPAILEWDGPVIAASVKNDLVKDTYKWRRTQGDVWLFDPTRSTGFDYEDVRAGWSPLSQAIDWGGARKVASWLCKANKAAGNNLSDGDFWFSAAEKMMSPYLFAAATGGKDMSTILRWIDTQEEREVMNILQRAGVPEAMTAFEANMKRDERTKSSIFTTAETIIDAYNDPLVCESAANPTIFASELLNGKNNTLYICAPSHEQERLQAIFTAIVSQMKSAAYELAGKQNRAIDPPLLICIDEAANIAPLSDLDAIASTAAGIGIQLVTIFQDMAQIEARYKERSRTVVNNHRAKVVLSGISDSGTLEYVSKLCGEEEVEQQSTSISAQGERSTTDSKQQRTLASGSYLRRMKFGEGIVVYGQLAPAKLILRPWYKDRVLKHMVEFGTKPGVMGGPAGANSFSGGSTITKEAPTADASMISSDARYIAGEQGNQMIPGGAVATNKELHHQMPGAEQPYVAPGSPEAFATPETNSEQLSAFDKALAELRARDASQPIAPAPTAPASPTATAPAPAPSSFASPEAKYTPGVPLFDESQSAAPASPSKWKPTSGGVPEDETPSGFAAVASPSPQPTAPAATPAAPEPTQSVSTESSKWGKGSRPKFVDTPPATPPPTAPQTAQVSPPAAPTQPAPVAPIAPTPQVPPSAPAVPTPTPPTTPIMPSVAPISSSPVAPLPTSQLPPAQPAAPAPTPTTPVAPTPPPDSTSGAPDVSDLFAQYSSSAVAPVPPQDAAGQTEETAETAPEDSQESSAPKSKWK
jgi:type IV secretion system protein VirD4